MAFSLARQFRSTCWLRSPAGTRLEFLIGACVLVRDAIDAYRGHREREDAFLAILVEGRVLPRAEAQLGFASPKLSKLRAVGDHADILRHPDVFPLLARATPFFMPSPFSTGRSRATSKESRSEQSPRGKSLMAFGAR